MIQGRKLLAVLAILSCIAMAVPPSISAQQAQRAGQVTIVIPIAEIKHGPEQAPAEVKKPVFWGDTISTGKLARARVALDDGSVLNVGSEAILQVVKHDAAAQQTDIDLTYGQVRAKVVKLTKPGSSFKIRTPTAVAGVVGTDFYIGFDNFTTQLYVYEGAVNFCNLGGACVTVAAGLVGTVHGDNPPDPPTALAPQQLASFTTSTVTAGPGAPPGGGVGSTVGVTTGTVATHTALTLGLVVGTVVVPAVVVRTTATTPKCSTGGSGMRIPHFCQQVVTGGAFAPPGPHNLPGPHIPGRP
ncbi:MAG: FecR family protein [Candidatus Acidiferrales bacterium]